MLVLRSEQTGETCRSERAVRVGRDGANDLVLPSTTVSSMHALIEWRESGWFVRDLGSRNGTAVDGARITNWTPLEAGSRLQFGPDNPWRVDAAERPEGAEDAGTFLEPLGGGARHRVAEDRFTIGQGATFDLCLEGSSGLLAVLYQEDDQCRVLALAGEDVAVAGRPVLAGEPAVLPPGALLTVLGQAWQLVMGGSDGVITVEAGLKARSYDGYRLVLKQRGDYGDIEVHDGGRVHRWEDQDRRFLLLWVLAEALGSSEGEPGWVDDTTLRASVWGRRAAEGLSGSTLSKLIHDTRAMFGRDGVDGLFLEKRRGRTRLRLDPDAVTLQG